MRKHRIRIIAALEFDNSAGCGASALSGYVLMPAKMVNYLGYQFAGGLINRVSRYSSG